MMQLSTPLRRNMFLSQNSAQVRMSPAKGFYMQRLSADISKDYNCRVVNRIKYYTLTSTCLYLLSFTLAPVWCCLSRQTAQNSTHGFVSASRAALRNVCLTETPRLLFGQNNPVVNLGRNVALGLGNFLHGWLYLGWRFRGREAFQEI